MYDNHKLGLVAYASVLGQDGTSPVTNSGVLTTKVAVGEFAIILPAGAGQASKDDLIVVQLKGSTPGITSAETDTDPNVKLIHLGSSSTTAVDSDFDVIIFRSLIPTSAAAPVA